MTDAVSVGVTRSSYRGGRSHARGSHRRDRSLPDRQGVQGIADLDQARRPAGPDRLARRWRRCRSSTPATSTTSSSGAACPAASRGSTSPAWSRSCSATTTLPGTTVNRYCSSSLQTTRMAYHAIKAGEGDVFISAGVECVSRSVQGLERLLAGHEEPAVRGGAGADRPGPRKPNCPGMTRGRTGSCPTSTSRWARPRRTSPRCAASPAPSRTSSASARRTSRRRRSPTDSGSGRSRR